MENNDARVAINSSADIVIARQKGRELAMELGFEGADLTLIATAISEVARNIMSNVKFAVESALDVKGALINVNIQDIRVSEDEAKK